MCPEKWGGGGGTAAALCADLVFRGSFNSKSLAGAVAAES